MFFQCLVLKITIIYIDTTHRQEFTKNPCWWELLCVGLFKMFYEILYMQTNDNNLCFLCNALLYFCP